MRKPNLRGWVPESWACMDCGVNTAPGHLAREAMEQACATDRGRKGIAQRVDERTEIYMVTDQIWKAAGMEPTGGCLCIACLEQRIGRTLTPEDFQRRSALNSVRHATERLLARRGRPERCD